MFRLIVRKFEWILFNRYNTDNLSGPKQARKQARWRASDVSLMFSTRLKNSPEIPLCIMRHENEYV